MQKVSAGDQYNYKFQWKDTTLASTGHAQQLNGYMSDWKNF
jgi:hypothetical protein